MPEPIMAQHVSPSHIIIDVHEIITYTTCMRQVALGCIPASKAYEKRDCRSIAEVAVPHMQSWSGRLDSNQRPPAPKAGALTKLRYAPNGGGIRPWYAPAPLPALSCQSRHASQEPVKPTGTYDGLGFIPTYQPCKSMQDVPVGVTSWHAYPPRVLPIGGRSAHRPSTR